MQVRVQFLAGGVAYLIAGPLIGVALLVSAGPRSAGLTTRHDVRSRSWAEVRETGPSTSFSHPTTAVIDVHHP